MSSSSGTKEKCEAKAINHKVSLNIPAISVSDVQSDHSDEQQLPVVELFRQPIRVSEDQTLATEKPIGLIFNSFGDDSSSFSERNTSGATSALSVLGKRDQEAAPKEEDVEVPTKIENVSVLSQEIGTLLMTKSGKKFKTKKKRNKIHARSSIDLVGDSCDITSLISQSTKRKKQPSGQRQILKQISELLLSDSSNDDELCTAVCTKGGDNTLDCKENIPVVSVSSGDLKSLRNEDKVAITNLGKKQNLCGKQDTAQKCSYFSLNAESDSDLESNSLKHDGVKTSNTLDNDLVLDDIKKNDHLEQSPNSGHSYAVLKTDETSRDIEEKCPHDLWNSSNDNDTSDGVNIPAISVSDVQGSHSDEQQLPVVELFRQPTIDSEDQTLATEKPIGLISDSFGDDSGSFSGRNTSGVTSALSVFGKRDQEAAPKEEDVEVPTKLENSSVLSQEIGTLLMTKSGKKCKTKKKKNRIHAGSSKESVGDSCDITSLISQSTKRKKQPSGQKQILKQISELLLSDSSNDDELCTAVCTKGGNNTLDCKESIPVGSVSSGNLKSPSKEDKVGTCINNLGKKQNLCGKQDTAQKCSSFSLNSESASDSESNSLKRDGVKTSNTLDNDLVLDDIQKNDHLQQSPNSGHSYPVLKTDETSRDLEEKCPHDLWNSSTDNDTSDGVNIPAISVSDVQGSHSDEQQLPVVELFRQPTIVSEDQTSATEKPIGLISDSFGNDSSSFSGRNTSGATSALSVSWNIDQGAAPKEEDAEVPTKIENMSVLSQEISTLLMTKSGKKCKTKKKRNKIHAGSSIDLVGDSCDITSLISQSTKSKKQPSGQRQILKQISELLLSDSSNDDELCTAVCTKGGDNTLDCKENIPVVSVSSGDLKSLRNEDKVAITNLGKKQNLCGKQATAQKCNSFSLNAESDSDLESNSLKHDGVKISNTLDNDLDLDDIQNNDHLQQSFNYGDSYPVLKTDETSRDHGEKCQDDLWNSSNGNDTSDDFLSMAADLKTKDPKLLSDKARGISLSDLSSDEAVNELYTTALKNITPESHHPEDSDSEDDMLDQFLDRMKLVKQESNTSGSSEHDQSLNEFIVSDNESLGGEEDYDNALYITTLSHESKERSCQVNPYNKSKSDLLSSFRDRGISNSFKTPRLQDLSISSDSDDDFTIPARSVYFKTPIHSNSQQVKPASTKLSSDLDDNFTTPANPVHFRTPISTNVHRVKPAKTKTKRCSFLQCLSDSYSPLYHQKDCEAVKYVKHFKKHKEELTSKLFTMYNHTVFENKLPDDLTVEWNSRLLKTAGYCSYKRKTHAGILIRIALIQLSTKVCDTAERVRDTLIHEICHAAVWILHGSAEGHGPIWKFFARKSNRVHPEVPTISRCHDYTINTKFTYKCTGCSYEIGRHSKSLDTVTKVCGYCRSPFQLQVNSARKPGSSRNVDTTPKTPRTPNAFALFVKDNYGSVKKENKGISHKDVMQQLSRDFKDEKVKLALS